MPSCVIWPGLVQSRYMGVRPAAHCVVVVPHRTMSEADVTSMEKGKTPSTFPSLNSLHQLKNYELISAMPSYVF